MTHTRAFLVKYYPPGNYRGARIGIKCLRSGQRVTFSYNYQWGTQAHEQAAEWLIAERGIECQHFACNDKAKFDLLITTDFVTTLKP